MIKGDTRSVDYSSHVNRLRVDMLGLGGLFLCGFWRDHWEHAWIAAALHRKGTETSRIAPVLITPL